MGRSETKKYSKYSHLQGCALAVESSSFILFFPGKRSDPGATQGHHQCGPWSRLWPSDVAPPVRRQGLWKRWPRWDIWEVFCNFSGGWLGPYLRKSLDIFGDTNNWYELKIDRYPDVLASSMDPVQRRWDTDAVVFLLGEIGSVTTSASCDFFSCSMRRPENIIGNPHIQPERKHHKMTFKSRRRRQIFFCNVHLNTTWSMDRKTFAQVPQFVPWNPQIHGFIRGF